VALELVGDVGDSAAEKKNADLIPKEDWKTLESD